jgi:penicillin amidase
MKIRRLLKFAAVALGGILVLTLVAGGGGALWLRSRLVASLPVQAGEIPLEGLADAVRIERDALGVPTLRGSSRLDLHRAVGFVHAQERFFQMDLLRRRAAGELAELVGPGAVPLDRAVRVHRFRSRADAGLAAAAPATRAMLEAYAEGVNAGLAALGDVPPEYVALRSTPRPWLPEDCLLIVSVMYLDLQGSSWRRESARGVLFDVLPTELAEFLTPAGTEWDAPLTGGPFTTPPIPGPEIFDLRQRAVGSDDRVSSLPPEPFAALTGSNNWAVAGTHTADGRALLANDMHLPLRVPNIWFRLRLVLSDEPVPEKGRSLVGVTLPGMPLIVTGSNGYVAWGFTNSNGDWADLVVLEPDGTDATAYRTPEGPRRFDRHEERIAVKDGDDVVVEVLETIWGPVFDEDHRGRRRALRWVAHEPAGTNSVLGQLEQARNVDEAVAIAARSGIPAQNFVVADRDGRIGWTIAGSIPKRTPGEATRPISWQDAGGPWDEWLEPQAYPRIVDPPAGRIWTANNRVVDRPELDAIGDGGFDLGARARQIRDDLLALEAATEGDLLAVQLDDRSVFLDRWRRLLLEVLDDEALADHPRRRELRVLAEDDWTGRASIDSAGFRMVRGFRTFLADQVFGAITAPCSEADERFRYGWTTFQAEGPLWSLVSKRPAHLLDPRFDDWDDQLLAAVDATIDYFVAEHGPSLGEHTWGRRNTTRIQHPLSQVVPQLSRWLDMPPEQLPGDSDMPRVQSPNTGASERMVVSPGLEARGLFHMPTGQSGHFLSPYYRRGHEAWARGEATPLLPGPTEHTLTLVPSREGTR